MLSCWKIWSHGNQLFSCTLGGVVRLGLTSKGWKFGHKPERWRSFVTPSKERSEPRLFSFSQSAWGLFFSAGHHLCLILQVEKTAECSGNTKWSNAETLENLSHIITQYLSITELEHRLCKIWKTRRPKIKKIKAYHHLCFFSWALYKLWKTVIVHCSL